MTLNYRRGSASIEAAATKKGGSGFRRFIPEIQWEDGETKYVLVLTDIEEVAEVLLHSFIPVGKGTKSNGEEYVRYEEFASRKWEPIGEDYDDLEDRLEREPKLRHMGVMVELEPVMEPGTKRIVSFVTKTETFQRKTDNGEVDVTAPVIGLCTQSAFLMWAPINTKWQRFGDLTQIPLAITRNGKQTNTRYDFDNYNDVPVDLSPVINFIDGINYIDQDDLPDLLQKIEAEGNEVGKAQAVADYLLVKRIDELADPTRYEELVSPLTLEDMPKNNWGRKEKSNNTPSSHPARPPRRSPRETQAEEPAPPPEPSRNERFAALKARVEARA